MCHTVFTVHNPIFAYRAHSSHALHCLDSNFTLTDTSLCMQLLHWNHECCSCGGFRGIHSWQHGSRSICYTDDSNKGGTTSVWWVTAEVMTSCCKQDFGPPDQGSILLTWSGWHNTHWLLYMPFVTPATQQVHCTITISTLYGDMHIYIYIYHGDCATIGT